MARIIKPLTNTEIERAKPQDTPYTLTDGNGLFLLISTTGSKTWQFNYHRPFSKNEQNSA
ncbi:integrase arm-type DNA-binding domain-containing protein [Avibacterium endocarditidis]|uniref:integrase arm-type DNA-binding domain-containing protein n=1 Tax=Avibacterium endocarditidis TaxID=380674 RepID=UPI003183BCB2